jgi:hypothetical protein
MMTRTAKGASPGGSVRLHIASTEGGWQVRREGSRRRVGVYTSRSEAVAAAMSVLRRSGGALAVQGRDGRLRESFTLGRDAMAHIAAVEGIRLSDETQHMLAELDRKRASNDDRRRAIARKFGSKA